MNIFGIVVGIVIGVLLLPIGLYQFWLRFTTSGNKHRFRENSVKRLAGAEFLKRKSADPKIRALLEDEIKAICGRVARRQLFDLDMKLLVTIATSEQIALAHRLITAWGDELSEPVYETRSEMVLDPYYGGNTFTGHEETYQVLVSGDEEYYRVKGVIKVLEGYVGKNGA